MVVAYAEEPVTGGEPPVVAFEGRRGAFLRLLLVNMLLNLVTLGIYRFWARTRVRRALWSMVRLRGEPLAYTGTGKELFIGFLVAMLVLLPVFVVITIIQNLVPPTEFLLVIGVNTGLGLLFGVLGVLAMYFARRYLLTRTAWRGIHAGQDGGWAAFTWAHLKAYVLVAVTLGLALPWAQARTYNYRMGVTWFGTGRFGANAAAGPLVPAYMAVWVTYALAYAFFFASFLPFMGWQAEAAAARQAGGAMPPFPGFGYLWIPAVVLFLAGMFLYARYLLVRFRHFTAHTWLEGTGFRCDIRTRQALYVAVVYLLLLVGAAAVLGGLSYLLIKAADGPGAKVFAGLVPILASFLFVLLMGMINQAWFAFEALRLICANLQASDPTVADEFLNRGAVAPRRGEGLADAIGDIGF
ncbi:DUF898 domain-containing protein [Aerophototrophica crusticola]|uniref:DUF898 domain-containing protein n=1 Tax=Aerophototrophica crusticola TaxID=1709002 RepID=A0A858RAX1_9PROT|nr:DUF898 domain-containing protein [Rhodospirillaceae bacterium B3]